MKNWPTRVNIIGRVYDVNIKDEPTTIEWGIVDDEEARITLFNGRRPPDEIMAILLHEMIHALSDRLGDKFEEPVVERWAHALSDTLVRNGLVDLPQPVGER